MGRRIKWDPVKVKQMENYAKEREISMRKGMEGGTDWNLGKEDRNIKAEIKVERKGR